MEHIDLAQTADLVLIAPATANIIGKVAGGIADDLLSTVVMATKAPVLFAPAMNNQMWTNPVVQGNVARLKALGYHFVEPESGALACGTEGPGRLARVETICAAATELLERNGDNYPLRKKGDSYPFSSEEKGLAVPLFSRLVVPDFFPLAKRTVIVTTGRTEEAIDPVRVLTNRSSGKMGFALAQAARAAGAKVVLVAGKTSAPAPAGLDVVNVTSTEEMLQALRKLLPRADVLFMAAAPADFRPLQAAGQKRKDRNLTLELERTPDILTELRQSGKLHPLFVGFSLETENIVSNARQKLRKKELDLIVANSIDTLDQDEIQATLIFTSGRIKKLPKQSKSDFAGYLIVEAARLLKPGAKNSHSRSRG